MWENDTKVYMELSGWLYWGGGHVIFEQEYRVFQKCWNKAAVSQIFPVEFILFLFSDYC